MSTQLSRRALFFGVQSEHAIHDAMSICARPQAKNRAEHREPRVGCDRLQPTGEQSQPEGAWATLQSVFGRERSENAHGVVYRTNGDGWICIGRLSDFPLGRSILVRTKASSGVVVFSLAEGLLAVDLREFLAGHLQTGMALRFDRLGNICVNCGQRWTAGTVLSTLTGMPSVAEAL